MKTNTTIPTPIVIIHREKLSITGILVKRRMRSKKTSVFSNEEEDE